MYTRATEQLTLKEQQRQGHIQNREDLILKISVPQIGENPHIYVRTHCFYSCSKIPLPHKCSGQYEFVRLLI
jgi:hypothetical protein